MQNQFFFVESFPSSHLFLTNPQRVGHKFINFFFLITSRKCMLNLNWKNIILQYEHPKLYDSGEQQQSSKPDEH